MNQEDWDREHKAIHAIEGEVATDTRHLEFKKARLLIDFAMLQSNLMHVAQTGLLTEEEQEPLWAAYRSLGETRARLKGDSE